MKKTETSKQMYQAPEASVYSLSTEAPIALSDMDVIVLATDGDDF